tara:strand:- start:248 stop:811 length:564 start_codon:yes stop_codon:yes gene_type:complete
MIKIDTIMMPYVEYTIKDHKKNKIKLQKKLKKTILDESVNEDMHISKTDYAVPQDIERPYRTDLTNMLNDSIGYMTDALGYEKVNVPHLYAATMKKNDVINWGTYMANFIGIYAFDIPDKKFEFKWFNPIEKKINIFYIKEGDVLFFPSYMNHKLVNLGKPKTFFIFSLNFSKGRNIENLLKDVEKK